MFRNYVFEQSCAQYEKKIILFDDDDLESSTKYSSAFAENGFSVIRYVDDLSYRLLMADKAWDENEKIAIIAHPNQYIPYDVCRRFYEFHVSFSELFPKLNASELSDTIGLNLDLLVVAYRHNFEMLTECSQTRQFIHSVMYGKNMMAEYIHHLEQELFRQCENARTYRDWFSAAQIKAQVDVAAAEMRIGSNTVCYQQKFLHFIMQNFGKLSTELNDDTPVLVSKAMEYMHERSKKFVLIVMDGMSEFDWTILEYGFAGIRYQKAAAFAMIPTVTSISRQCLLSGKYPSQLLSPWSLANEKKEFTMCAKSMGYTDSQISYQRGYEAHFDSRVKCGAVIINEIDDIVHGQLQGRVGMLNDVNFLRESGKLPALVKTLLQQGFDVYISADHGNTPCMGMGKLTKTGIEVETKSSRMVVLNDLADKDRLIQRYSLLEYPQYYLKKDLNYLLCDVGQSLDAPGEAVMSHGGITIDECIVPFITIKAEENNG